MAYTDYTTPGSGSFTVPTAAKSIIPRLIGGGGAGNSGSGGGGGGYADKTISTSPGASFSFFVGYGDTDGTYDSSQDTSWNGGVFTATGGQPGGGGNPGAGGSGSGAYDTVQSGGAGGYYCNTSCDTCNSCNSYCCGYDSYMNCLTTCYSCSSTSNSSCGANGGGGASGSFTGTGGAGDNASCTNNSTDGCGYCTGTNCTNASGGTPADFTPGGYGGPGGGLGGGGAGGNEAGYDGLVRVEWTPGYIAITTQPSNTVQNTIISPSPTVEIRFSDNTVDTSYNGPVTVLIYNNPSGGTLSGTTTINAVSGIATFTDLSIDNIGINYSIAYTCTDVSDGFSALFNITAPSAFVATYQVHAFNRPALEADQNLRNLRPSRAIR